MVGGWTAWRQERAARAASERAADAWAAAVLSEHMADNAWAAAVEHVEADARTAPAAKLAEGAKMAAVVAELAARAGAWTDERVLAAEMAAAAHERAAGAAELATWAHDRSAADAWTEMVIKPRAAHDSTAAEVMKAADELRAADAWTAETGGAWAAAVAAELRAADAWTSAADTSRAAVVAERNAGTGAEEQVWAVFADRAAVVWAVTYDWTRASNLWGEVGNRAVVGTCDLSTNNMAMKRCDAAVKRSAFWEREAGPGPVAGAELQTWSGTSGHGVGGPPGFP